MQTEPQAAPRLLLKAIVRSYVTKTGKLVEAHEDSRPPAMRREPEGGPAGPPRQGGGEEEQTSPRTPKAKHYAQPRPTYRVGQRVRLPGRDGVYEVTAVGDGQISVVGQGGEKLTVKTGGGTMAKAEPRLLLKASGSDPKRQGDKGKAMGGSKGKPAEQPATRAASGAPAEREVVPKRGAPDGEPEMSHGDRVKFQHGKVAGEGEIVASGADGVMVLDDNGREHPIRHDNLIGAADSQEGGEAEVEDGEGDAEAPEQDQAGEIAATLKNADPSKLSKMLRALKLLAPFFGDGGAAGKAKADKAAPAKPAAKKGAAA